MSFGNFYEVDDSTRQLLIGCTSKSDWYGAMGQLALEACPTFEAEESLPAWESILQGMDGSLSTLFSGELRAEKDEFPDPDVAFLGAPMVKSIAEELGKKSHVFFEDILDEAGFDDEAWLYEPRCRFFDDAAAKDKAAIVLWGG